jgi:DNA-binding transcriptional LysR family regulator
VDSTEAAKRCVQHGLGLAFISRQAVAADSPPGCSRSWSSRERPVKRTFYVLHHRAVTLSKLAREFLDLALQRNR